MADPTAASKQNANPQVAAKPAVRNSGRWLKRGLILMLLFGMIGWFAPAILATKLVRNYLPKLLFSKFTGTINIGETTLSWISPVVIKNFQIRDDVGQPLFEFERFSTSAPLWSMMLRPQNIGTCKVVNPVIHVSFSDTDSNIERALANLIGKQVAEVQEENQSDKLDTDSPGRLLAPGFTLEIENARVELEHPRIARKSTIDSISLRLVSQHGVVDECDLAIGNPPVAGEITLASDWLIARYGNPTDENSAINVSKTKHALLRASQWKLDRLAPALPRFMSNIEINGELNADASTVLTPTPTGVDWNWQGRLSIEKLMVAGIEALHRDVLALDRVELSGQAAATQGRFAVHDLQLTTDVGELSATGDFPLEGYAQQASDELVKSLLGDDDYHIDGRVDLKKLAAILPQTLRIREGVEITSGEIKVQIVGAAVEGVRRWSGAAGIVGLNAINQGQVIPWDRPIAARVNAHREGDTVIVDQLQCKSDFLEVSGHGTIDDAHFTASGDLSKLLVNIERFVDLGLEELSGQMAASGDIRRHENDRVELTSRIVVNDFAYAATKSNIWRELHLELSVTAAGQTDSQRRLTNITSGEIHLISGIDKLDLLLQTPIDLTSSKPAYAVATNLKGSLASWQNRMRPLTAVNDWRLAGDVSLTSSAMVDADQVDVNQLVVQLQQFEAIGPEWLIDDPDLKLQATARWDKNAQRLTAPKVNLNGKSLGVNVTDLDVTYGPQGLASLTGSADYRAELTQLSGWKNRAIKNPTHYLIGALSGTTSVTRQNNVLVGSADTTVEKFIIAGQGVGVHGQPQWVALWKEPQLRWSSQGSYDPTVDRLSLDASQFSVEGLSMDAAGTLENCSTNRRIDLTGNLAYDWSQLTKRLSPQLAQQIQLTGKDHRPFTIKGSLATNSGSSAAGTSATAAPVSFSVNPNVDAGNNSAKTSAGLVDLRGKAGLGWDTANLFGFSSGAGELSTQIERGVCRIAPIDLVVNDGKLHVSPTIYLDQTPMILVLPPGRLIDQVNLTPELCHDALKYVAPLLADATQIDGKISLDVEAVSLPLFDSASGTAGGVLSIHHVQAKPGPFSLQILGMINEIRSLLSRQPPAGLNRDQVWVQMIDQQIPFKLERGRVYHQGMKFIVKNVVVQTSGSVGLDNTLDIVAEIVIPDEWIANKKLLAGMKGKTIQIPISGTIGQPKVDPSGLANLAKQISGSAIDGLLDDKVGDGLKGVINNRIDKLLRGKK